MSIFVIALLALGGSEPEPEPSGDEGPQQTENLLQPSGSCQYDYVEVGLDEPMGDGFTARDVLEASAGSYSTALEWYSSEELTDLEITLSFGDTAV